jgi:hypothetical protein
VTGRGVNDDSRIVVVAHEFGVGGREVFFTCFGPVFVKSGIFQGFLHFSMTKEQ